MLETHNANCEAFLDISSEFLDDFTGHSGMFLVQLDLSLESLVSSLLVIQHTLGDTSRHDDLLVWLPLVVHDLDTLSGGRGCQIGLYELASDLTAVR